MGKVTQVIKTQRWFITRMALTYFIGKGVMTLLGTAVRRNHSTSKVDEIMSK